MIFLVFAALIAFAANSLLCRFALDDLAMPAYDFTLVRLISGAFTLVLISICLKVSALRRHAQEEHPPFFSSANLQGGVYLAAYAFFFSYAYLALEAGSGAFILFLTVQITMVGISFLRGQTLTKHTVIGMLVACVGFVILFAGKLTGTHPVAIVMMALSGISWGLYSLLGEKGANTLEGKRLAVTRHFVIASLIGALLLPILSHDVSAVVQHPGFVFALLSGVVTSALGYVLWYYVLGHISAYFAAIAQLLVPPLAMLMGWFILDETITGQVILAVTLISFGAYWVKAKTA